MNSWDTVIKKCGQTTYHRYMGTDIVPSYFQFYAQNNPCIPATDGKCYKAVDVYVPSLKGVIGKHFPVADFDQYITKERAEFLGFKRHISFSDCFEILKSIEDLKLDAELSRHTSSIYKVIVRTSSDLSQEEINSIKVWRETGKLLAINNTFQPLKGLHCFNVSSLNAPVSSEYFLKIPLELTGEEIKAFTLLFEIPLLTYEKLRFVTGVNQIEKDLKSALLLKANFFATLYSHQVSENHELVYYRLVSLITNTTFYTSEKLSLVYESVSDKEVYNSVIESWHDDQSNAFYYSGNSPLTLYSLSNSLCSFLGIIGIEREVGKSSTSARANNFTVFITN
jgi:hypothetical protein